LPVARTVLHTYVKPVSGTDRARLFTLAEQRRLFLCWAGLEVAIETALTALKSLIVVF
jgi:hypothetical protein